MNTMNYKGYAARIEYSEEDDCFVGHIAGINDVVGFPANTVAKLHKAFKEQYMIILILVKKQKDRHKNPIPGISCYEFHQSCMQKLP